MTSYCQYALKEWSVTDDSLLAGRQILLLRKDGIHERDGFKVEHPKFVLFPTHLQQDLQGLHPSFQPDLDKPGSSRTSTVILNTFVPVQELIPISNLKALQTVGGMHALSGIGLIRRPKSPRGQTARKQRSALHDLMTAWRTGFSCHCRRAQRPMKMSARSKELPCLTGLPNLR